VATRAKKPEVARKGRAKDMSLDVIVATLAVTLVIIGLLVALGLAALRFGVDSRPGIGDDRLTRFLPTV